MTLAPLTFIHGTAVAFGKHAVLLRGPSGAGKSDLALRLLALDPTRLAPAEFNDIRLIADDQVNMIAGLDHLIVSAPAPLSGLLEVRGVGIVQVPIRPKGTLHLVIDLVPPADVPRIPVKNETVELLGHAVPKLALHAFEASAPLKCLLALVGALDGAADGAPRS